MSPTELGTRGCGMNNIERFFHEVSGRSRKPSSRCRWFHRWRYVWGTHNRYFKCARCPARQARLGRGGYQPIDMEWLHRILSDGRPRPRMPQPADIGLPLGIGRPRLTVRNDNVPAEAAPNEEQEQ